MAAELSFAENFTIAAAAATYSKTTSAPIERVKLLLQSQSEILRVGRLDRPYRGIIDCTVRTFRTEGIYAFWRGNLVNCIGFFPTQALNFALKDRIKKTLAAPKDAGNVRKVVTNVSAGGVAGMSTMWFVYSLSYTRARLANDVKVVGKDGVPTRQFTGIIDVYAKTYKSDGIRGLYRGFVVSCVGIFVYRGLYFGLYDTLRPMLRAEGAGMQLFSSFCLGYGVTITAGIMTYPFDTVRHRLLMRSGETVKYKGAVDCAGQIVRKEGFMSLMSGLGANMLRGVAGAVLLVAFESGKKVYISFRVGGRKY